MVNYPIGGEFMRNILILRKTDEFAENLADGLRLNGLNVTVCNSQITAEEMLLSGDIDIAVFDVVVPGGDGIEFLKKCK
jgi:DNA-binding response OmpR family regulator